MRYFVKAYAVCTACGLCKTRRNIVFGRGTLPAKILFIGEAPGKTEDLMGVPFVGPSGRLLDAAIALACEYAGIPKPPSFFITNTVACRPTDSANGENRQPSDAEILACWGRLEQTYMDINPEKVILLGKVAKVAVLRSFPTALCLPHPAYILRLGGAESPAFTTFARDLGEAFKELK